MKMAALDEFCKDNNLIRNGLPRDTSSRSKENRHWHRFGGRWRGLSTWERMHGRLKVKTTAQQEAEKKAERAKKVEHYKAAMAQVFQMRAEEGEVTDAMLKVTAGLLLSNPDITTLWNIRKQTIDGLKDSGHLQG